MRKKHHSEVHELTTPRSSGPQAATHSHSQPNTVLMSDSINVCLFLWSVNSHIIPSFMFDFSRLLYL